MEATMAGASSVGVKFGDIMSGLSGSGSKLMAAIERLAIAVSNALAPSLTQAATSIADVIEQATEFVKANQGAVLIAAKLAAGAVAIGGAMIALGTAMMLGSTAVGLFLRPLSLISSVGLGATGAVLSLTRSVVMMAATGVASAATFAASMAGTALASIITFSSSGLAALSAYVARSAALLALAAVAPLELAASSSVAALAGMVASAVSSAATAAAAMVTGAATSSAAWVAANATAAVAFVQVRAAAVYAALQSAASFSWLSTSAISSAAASSAAWVANMGRVAASAVASGAVSMAAFAKTAAAAIAAGAVTTASLLAPFLLVGAAIAAGVAIVYTFRDSLFSAFSGTVEMAQATGNAVLATSASFAAPFLEWIGGQKMVLDAVEPWIAFIQNVITAAGTNIAIGWEHMWFGMSQTVRTIGAVMMGMIDNFVTPILNLFDEIKLAVSAVAYEIDQATTLSEGTHAKQKQEREAYVAEVRGGMAKRVEGSGINVRLEEAGKQKEIARGEMNARTGAMQDAADKTMGDRLQGVEDRRKERESAAAEAAKPKEPPTTLATPITPPPPLPDELAAASGGIAAAVDLKNESMGSFSALSAGGQGIGSTAILNKQYEVQQKMLTALEAMGPFVA
jgi:hypothetical protein